MLSSSPQQPATGSSLQGFLDSTNPTIPLWSFAVNLAIAGLLCFAVAQVYVRFGRSLSNRSSLARNFVMIGVTTMLIISIVKSSLALSLGLVGALSIVRFRTAIKEPEELAYLFLTISIGLGLGANQWVITSAAVAIIVAGIALRGHFGSRSGTSNLYLTVRRESGGDPGLGHVTRTLQENCSELSLMRFDESGEAMEACYLVNFDDVAQLERAKSALQSQGAVSLSFVDSHGIL